MKIIYLCDQFNENDSHTSHTVISTRDNNSSRDPQQQNAEFEGESVKNPTAVSELIDLTFGHYTVALAANDERVNSRKKNWRSASSLNYNTTLQTRPTRTSQTRPRTSRAPGGNRNACSDVCLGNKTAGFVAWKWGFFARSVFSLKLEKRGDNVRRFASKPDEYSSSTKV